MYVCVYVCVWVYVYVGMCICIYVYVYLYVYIYMYMCICVYVYMYVSIYVCVCICMCIYVNICIYIYIYIYVCMYVYVYIYIYILLQQIVQWCFCSPLYPVSMYFCILVVLFIVTVCSILCDCPTVHSSYSISRVRLYNLTASKTCFYILEDVKMKLEKDKCRNVVSRMTFRLP